MNILLFMYLITGYCKAFTFCEMFEAKHKTALNMFETGWVILLFMLFWLPLYMFGVYYNVVMILMYNIISKKIKKELKK